MTYRTRTYIAADWSGDKDAVEQLYKWNDGYWSLSFTNAHDLTQSSDYSLNCSIKSSLKKRMDASKTFILIVGNKTNFVTAGSCRYCSSYNSWMSSCARRHSIDYRSYIKYECDKAVESGIKIVVLYNSTTISRSKCPEAVRYKGTHVAMKCSKNGNFCWDYNAVKNALRN